MCIYLSANELFQNYVKLLFPCSTMQYPFHTVTPQTNNHDFECENYIQIIFAYKQQVYNKLIIFFMSKTSSLTQDGLELTLGAEIAVEARAGTSGVVADTTTGAVTTSGVAQTLKGVRAGGALDLRAVRTTTANIADATNVHLSVPRGGVGAAGLRGELLLGEADTSLVAVIRAHGTLTGNAIIVGVARALASLSVTSALVGALGLGVSVVGAHHGADPGSTQGAGSGRAISLSPGGKSAVHSRVALALVIATARAVTAATIGAEGRSTSQQRNKNSNNLHFNCVINIQE
jgi:hypothetical protein